MFPGVEEFFGGWDSAVSVGLGRCYVACPGQRRTITASKNAGRGGVRRTTGGPTAAGPARRRCLPMARARRTVRIKTFVAVSPPLKGPDYVALIRAAAREPWVPLRLCPPPSALSSPGRHRRRPACWRL